MPERASLPPQPLLKYNLTAQIAVRIREIYFYFKVVLFFQMLQTNFEKKRKKKERKKLNHGKSCAYDVLAISGCMRHTRASSIGDGRMLSWRSWFRFPGTISSGVENRQKILIGLGYPRDMCLRCLSDIGFSAGCRLIFLDSFGFRNMYDPFWTTDKYLFGEAKYPSIYT